MKHGTGIQWTHFDGFMGMTWNPVTGCTKVSSGCTNCYAEALHNMRHKAFLDGKKMPPQYAKPFKVVQTHHDRLDQPLRWKKPRAIFVNSMSDLFHEDVSDNVQWEVLNVAARTPRHIYIVLTKRPVAMRRLMNLYVKHGDVLPNVILGVSVENQATADERIPLLLQTPAAVRMVSYEPALGPVDFGVTADGDPGGLPVFREAETVYEISMPSGITTPRPGRGWAKYDSNMRPTLDWIVAGGESGDSPRYADPEYFRNVRDQAKAAGAAFFMKQMTNRAPIPNDLLVREFPTIQESIS